MESGSGQGMPRNGGDWDRRASLFDVPVPGKDDPFVSLVLSISEPDPSYSTLLDIGCGTGTYPLAMADQFHRVEGVDVSQEMVSIANRKAEERGASNAEFRVCDWTSVKTSQLGKFNVVTARLTPAVATPEGFAKMMSVAGGWCFYAGYVSRGNPMWDEIYRITGKRGDVTEPQRLLNAIEVLWKAGRRPKLEYIAEHRARTLTAEEARTMYVEGAKGFSELTGEQEKEIREAIDSRIEDGVFRDTSDPVIGVVCWNTEEYSDERDQR
jgi:SAM-dependent methyltransferase